MNVGKVFEKNWKESVPDDVYYFRIKDSASSFGQDSSATRFTLDNPYDSFLFWEGILFPMELKSTKGTSISIQKIKSEKSKMIKLNQIKGLLYASSFKNVQAGFLFDFRTTNNTYFIHIHCFDNFLKTSEKKSINEKDTIEFGGILIEKILKKTNYKYDVKKLLDDIKEVQNET